MRYDDRLATVLRLPTGGRNLARVQLRQLLDLLGAAPSEARSDLLDAAYLRLSELCKQFPPTEITTLLAEPGLRLRSPRLLACLARGAPQVARAALHAARLDEASWLDLIPALPVASWSLLWERRDLGHGPRALLARLGAGSAALPPVIRDQEESEAEGATPPLSPALAATLADPEGESPPTAPDSAPSSPDLPSHSPDVPSQDASADEPQEDIGAIVRRIEAFRRARDAAPRPAPPASRPASSSEAPRLPLGEEPAQGPSHTTIHTTFDFETDSEGRIIAADIGLAPMIVGLSLAETSIREPIALVPAELAGGLGPLITQQQPIRGVLAQLEGAPAIAGLWHLDATPRFDTLGGRFTGYLGRFRRAQPALGQQEPAPPTPAKDSPTDRLRQSLHELRTPVNAIQGFAEIIQQQLFGHTPHEYRALAAAIAADAARMLAGFEELERFARLDSGAMAIEHGESDLADCVCATLVRLEHHTQARGIALELERLTRPLPLALAAIETERLCWRLLATLAATAAPGERLGVAMRRIGDQACLELSLPAALANLSDEELYHAAVAPGEAAPSAGMFGTGFTLRLAASEARAAGGSLLREGPLLRLTLPGAFQAAQKAVDAK